MALKYNYNLKGCNDKSFLEISVTSSGNGMLNAGSEYLTPSSKSRL